MLVCIPKNPTKKHSLNSKRRMRALFLLSCDFLFFRSIHLLLHTGISSLHFFVPAHTDDRDFSDVLCCSFVRSGVCFLALSLSVCSFVRFVSSRRVWSRFRPVFSFVSFVRSLFRSRFVGCFGSRSVLVRSVRSVRSFALLVRSFVRSVRRSSFVMLRCWYVAARPHSLARCNLFFFFLSRSV